jgi:F-box-like
MAFLQNLLPETLELIASYLDQPSLAAMTRSCRHINTCCTRMLYKDIVLDDVACCRLDRTISQKPNLVTWIQSFTFDNDQNYADHFADFILPQVPGVQHLRYFARTQGFFDRGMDKDENALGLGLWWPGPDERVPCSVRVAAQSLSNLLPALKTCKS